MLRQPNNFAWQVFDGKIVPMLRDEYRIKRVSKVSANTLEEFANKLEGVDSVAFLDEIKKYNAAVKKDVKFNPNIKDGRSTVGLDVNKSNWANTIDQPPFEAYQVGCGVSFTFGGVRIDPDSGQVIDSDMNPIPGLYAAGELVGGIFYFNYPGGSGLMSGAVFGKIAGTGAASFRNACSWIHISARRDVPAFGWFSFTEDSKGVCGDKNRGSRRLHRSYKARPP